MEQQIIHTATISTGDERKLRRGDTKIKGGFPEEVECE